MHRTPLASLVLAAVVAGCATPSPGASSPASAPPATAQPSAAPTPVTLSPGAVSHLQRRDVPPDGVAAQLEFFAGGIESCSRFDETVPAVLVGRPPPMTASGYDLCVMGFAGDVTIDVTLSLPDGTVRDFVIPAPRPGVAVLELEVLPGEPIGDYEATATQGELRATGSYEVFTAAFPRIHTVQPASRPPGSTFRFALAGFPLESEVTLDLYQFGSGNGYLTTLPAQGTDALGEAIFDLPTTTDDPQGRYCVVPRGAEVPRIDCDGFFELAD